MQDIAIVKQQDNYTANLKISHNRWQEGGLSAWALVGRAQKQDVFTGTSATALAILSSCCIIRASALRPSR